MTRKIFFLAFFLFCGLLNFAQNEQGLQELPEPLHFQLKAMENGETMLNLDTRKQTFTIQPQKQANDTTIQFQWENKKKTALLRYLNKDNIIEKLEKISSPKPDNLKQTGRVIYFSIEKGKQKNEFWISPEKIKDNPKADFFSEFTRNLITIFEGNKKEHPKHD